METAQNTQKQEYQEAQPISSIFNTPEEAIEAVAAGAKPALYAMARHAHVELGLSRDIQFPDVD